MIGASLWHPCRTALTPGRLHGLEFRSPVGTPPPGLPGVPVAAWQTGFSSRPPYQHQRYRPGVNECPNPPGNAPQLSESED